MGHLTGLVGILLVISTCSSQTARDVDIPMRMAEDGMVVSNYGSTSAGSPSRVMSPDDSTEYQIYQGVMGRPGVDFPVFTHIPATSFSCKQIKHSGYYADLETDCQVFHICDGGRKISFLCPNGTIFRQSHLICDWWFRVDCGKSVELYEESAEQLAADQKFYKARSDDREKRKKAVLAAHGEEDIYGLDEPYQSSKNDHKQNSRRVMNADFSQMYPGRQGKHSEEVKETTGILSLGNERRTTPRQSTTVAPVTFHPRTRTPIVYAPTSSSPAVTFNPRARTPSNSFYESFQQAASGALTNNYRTQHVFAVDKTLFQTRQPFTTPSTTTLQEEQERQHLAESASFASHRGGRTFFDFNTQNHLHRNFQEHSTTYKIPTTTVKTLRYTGKSEEVGSVTSDKNYKFRKTEERLKYVPFSTVAPVYKPTVPVVRTTATTMSIPTTYSAQPTRIPAENIFFTTIQPETSATPTFTENKLGTVSQKTDVDVSLQELDIQKTTVTTEGPTIRPFTEETRDGLQVPPSAGPSALRSFALYFAGTDDVKAKKLPFLPENVLIIPIRKNAGKATNVLQQVDEVVRASNATVLPSQPNPESLPSSLTPNTKTSYNALFSSDLQPVTEQAAPVEPTFIQKNDLTSSQSRGIVEPDIKSNQVDDKYSRIAPDLRELAQVFTKALSAYLDDPEGFRKALSEIRPTEPSPVQEVASAGPVEYPSATKEEDEVLDFSDVTKPSSKRTTTETSTEATTEAIIEITTTIKPDISNYVLPLSSGLNTSETRYQVPDQDLRAPYETLDQSQSSYYTAAPSEIGTTNAIAEEINKELAPRDFLPDINSNEAVDSYQPVSGTVDDPSRPRYGGFQNNSYRPYGAELTSTALPETKPTTYKPANHTSALFSRLKEEEARLRDEAELVREVNNLVTRPLPIMSNVKTSKSHRQQRLQSFSTHPVFSERWQPDATTPLPELAEPNPLQINLDLSPPSETESPHGFFVTYDLTNGNPTKRPLTTTIVDEVTTITTEAPTERTTLAQTETFPPTTTEQVIRTTITTTTTTTPLPPTTRSHRRGKAKSLERIVELQEALMFNSTKMSSVEKEMAREMVEETVSNMTMNDMTAKTLATMMEMAAKNETYRRLVLLLVNDRSGRNKTVEEARISLLRALLTPVIIQNKQKEGSSRRVSLRRGKNLQLVAELPIPTTPRMRVTTSSPDVMYRKTTARPRVVTTTTTKPSTVIGNLGLIRKTIEESKSKDIRINSLDDAVLDSDARAIELLRSLYSLAARWG